MKRFIIDIMLEVATKMDVLADPTLTNKHKNNILESMCFLFIYQKLANNQRFYLSDISEYFEFSEIERFVFDISSCWISQFGIIYDDTWVINLLELDHTQYTLTYKRNDIGSSYIEIPTLTNDTPITIREHKISIDPSLKHIIKPPKPTLAKAKNKFRPRKKPNNSDLDFE